MECLARIQKRVEDKFNKEKEKKKEANMKKTYPSKVWPREKETFQDKINLSKQCLANCVTRCTDVADLVEKISYAEVYYLSCNIKKVAISMQKYYKEEIGIVPKLVEDCDEKDTSYCMEIVETLKNIVLVIQVNIGILTPTKHDRLFVVICKCLEFYENFMVKIVFKCNKCCPNCCHN